MPELSLRNLGRSTALEEQARMRVAECLETGSLNLETIEDRPEALLHNFR
jgi:hypothetical protein